MRGIRHTLILLPVLALVACAGPAGVTTSTGPTPRAERPTYTLGEKWIRNDGAYELIRIENDRYIFAAGPTYEVQLTKDLALARVARGEKYMEFDPPARLDWPLEVGKWGTIPGTWRGNWNIVGARVRFIWSVDAYEDVRIPAGTLKAFRISLKIEGWGFVRELRIWYAPGAKQLVRAEGQDLGLPSFRVVSLDRPLEAQLRVALEEPKDQARVSTESLVLTGKVAGDKGVARVTVTLNGQEVARQEAPGAPKPEVPLNVPFTLQEGKNILLVTAVDAEGATRQEARTLFYDKPAPSRPSVARPPATTAPSRPGGTPPTTATPSPSPAPTPEPPTPRPAIVPPSPSMPPAALPPFQVTLTAPQDQARVEQESIALAGLVSGGKGVSRVIVTLNGVEVSRQDEKTAQRALPLNLPLKLQEGQNTLAVTATEADGRITQEVRTIHFEKRLPLTVAVRYPEDRARLSEEASVIAALVTSSKGVAKASVTLNGVEIHQQSERTPPKSLVVTAPVKFREGANTIVVSASEPDGTIRQELRTVIYDKPKEAAPTAGPPPPPPARNRWAVVVGVGRYESPEIPRLRYTVPDAEAIYEILTGPAGFKPEHVFLLTDRTERKPTLRNVKWALGTFLARSAQKDDTVLIFFAGHGAPEVDQRGIERDGLAKYLIPSDADPDDLYSTALPMDELQTIFGRSEAERVVVFLDACYSGAAGGRTFASKRTRAMNLDDLFLERLTRAKGRAIITASRTTEVSIEMPELGHGLFTYYLVRGLQGAADLNRDGIVSLQELYEYVEQQVSQKARAVGGNQHPVMKGELEGVLPLVKVKGP